MSVQAGANVHGGVRAKVCKIGWDMEKENAKYKSKMNFSELARRANVSSPTAKLWWSRRDELLTTGNLKHKPRSGRPPHTRFQTPQKAKKSRFISWAKILDNNSNFVSPNPKRNSVQNSNPHQTAKSTPFFLQPVSGQNVSDMPKKCVT